MLQVEDWPAMSRDFSLALALELVPSLTSSSSLAEGAFLHVSKISCCIAALNGIWYSTSHYSRVVLNLTWESQSLTAFKMPSCDTLYCAIMLMVFHCVFSASTDLSPSTDCLPNFKLAILTLLEFTHNSHVSLISIGCWSLWSCFIHKAICQMQHKSQHMLCCWRYQQETEHIFML